MLSAISSQLAAKGYRPDWETASIIPPRQGGKDMERQRKQTARQPCGRY